MATDFTVLNAGSLFILNPITEKADAWVEEKVGINDETQLWGQTGCVVEQRNVQPDTYCVLEDGLGLEIAS